MSRYDRGRDYWGRGGWGPYVSVAEKKALGRKAAEALAKKENRDPCPVQTVGRELAKTFWGKKWCENLNRYSSIANRLPRGATYVRNGSVADLVIESGRVRAIVGGSEAYTVTIKIGTLNSRQWQSILTDCASGIETLLELLQGRFSTQVMTRLTQEKGGLFPEKGEISMKCSCPDSAGVCKHIAAVFYGVAVRLDQQPELLFRLRNVDHLELIGRAGTAAALDEALGVPAQAEFAGEDLSGIFGIDLELAGVGDSVKASESKAGRKTPKKAVKKLADKAVEKEVSQASSASATKAAKKVVKKTAKKTAEKTAEQAVITAVRKAVKKSARDVVKKAVKKAVKKTVKKADRGIEQKPAGSGGRKGRTGD